MKKKYIILSLLACFLFAAVIWLIWGNVTVGLTNVTFTDADLPIALDGLKIAHVSDLHNSRLWEKAITQLSEARPDLICMTGDLVDSRHPDFDLALEFVAEAVKIAPCYYIPGNHEHRFEEENFTQLMDSMKLLGVHVLLNEMTEFEYNGEVLQIVGLSQGHVKNLPETEGYRLLLAHRPEQITEYAQQGYNLVLSGHAHGGQARLPLIGGLYAPGQGILPEYDAGFYHMDGTTMYVSRGIGNSGFPIRFANRPEVILITLNCG